jgi:hypothetical protein
MCLTTSFNYHLTPFLFSFAYKTPCFLEAIIVYSPEKFNGFSPIERSVNKMRIYLKLDLNTIDCLTFEFGKRN